MDKSGELLTVAEVSAYLRKSPSTIYRLARQGQLPCKKIGGTWRFSREDLEEWIRVPQPKTPVNASLGEDNVDPDRLHIIDYS